MVYTRDNLGLNSTTGFPESFNSTYYCRLYRATDEQCKWLTKEVEDLIRDVKNYNYDLEHGTAGVVGPCVFNDLDSFHIAENQCLDIMHDLFEGVAKYVIEKVLTS